ncbi:MAG: GSCFA domain-containing protein [Pseudomonadota bacterium]
MNHPYRSQPDYVYWGRAVAKVAPALVDPVVSAPFSINTSDKVATAGSCFAQHIARYLRNNGFNYYIEESCHPLFGDEAAAKYNYGTFSARYGNVYTARQLLQLFDRAFGEFDPVEKAWQLDDGSWVDPLRPQIQPGGFRTRRELDLDRAQHLRHVKVMFQELDVFVFTFGLTECWVSRDDGTAYPVCPGVSGGTFDPDRYRFINFGVEEVNRDFVRFMDKLRNVNPKARVILTVSPVPLVATAEDRHVLVSTAYSKSVLRVVAEQISRKYADVAYFPSYEIITSSFTRGRYFANDLRSVTEEGVEHVMRLYLRHYCGRDLAAPVVAGHADEHTQDDLVAEMQRLVEVNCDEIALDPCLAHCGSCK